MLPSNSLISFRQLLNGPRWSRLQASFWGPNNKIAHWPAMPSLHFISHSSLVEYWHVTCTYCLTFVFLTSPCHMEPTGLPDPVSQALSRRQVAPQTLLPGDAQSQRTVTRPSRRGGSARALTERLLADSAQPLASGIAQSCPDGFDSQSKPQRQWCRPGGCRWVGLLLRRRSVARTVRSLDGNVKCSFALMISFTETRHPRARDSLFRSGAAEDRWQECRVQGHFGSGQGRRQPAAGEPGAQAGSGRSWTGAERGSGPQRQRSGSASHGCSTRGGGCEGKGQNPTTTSRGWNAAWIEMGTDRTAVAILCRLRTNLVSAVASLCRFCRFMTSRLILADRAQAKYSTWGGTAASCGSPAAIICVSFA